MTSRAINRARRIVEAREDILRAAANPGTPVELRFTRGASRATLRQRAWDYRRGELPFGMALRDRDVDDCYAVENDNVLAIVLAPGVQVPEEKLEYQRSRAILDAWQHGSAPWPEPEGSQAWRHRNTRLRSSGLKILPDRTIIRIKRAPEAQKGE